MSKVSIPPIPSTLLKPVADMGLADLERLRLILRGGSVIDWRRMHFANRAEVNQFLGLCGYDMDSPLDEAWARIVLADAVEYLRKTFHYRVTEAVAHPEEIHELFLYASGLLEPRQYRKIACIVLKVMHVIQHIEGRDLLFRLAVSEAQLSELVTRAVMSALDPLLEEGGPLVAVSDSMKSRTSLVTKLIAKKETVAAQVYDKTRFRLVTRTPEDVVPVLQYLTQYLFPFNFLVPGQTDNSLLPFKQMIDGNPHFSRYLDDLQLDKDYEESEQAAVNQFSGEGYRVLNFVADVPLRMDAYLPPPDEDRRERKNRVGFMLVEFQLVDEATALANEHGENAHERYKKRQLRKVLHRLSNGLIVPKAPVKKPR